MLSSVSIGPNGHWVSIPVISSVTAPIWTQFTCFDCLEHTLCQQIHSHSVPELITALDEALPIKTTAAMETALNMCGLVIEAAADINNLEHIVFLGRSGLPVDVKDPSPDKRPEGIPYIRLHCCIQGPAIDQRIHQPDYNFEFMLSLPQAPKDNATEEIVNICGYQTAVITTTQTTTNSTTTVTSKQSHMFKPKSQSSSGAPFSVSWYRDVNFLNDQAVFNKEFGSKTPNYCTQTQR